MPRDPERNDQLDEEFEAEGAGKPADRGQSPAAKVEASRAAADKRPRASRPDLEDDEDDETDEDGEQDDEEEERARRRERARRAAPARPAKPAIKYDEKEINSPSLLTLGMLGSVSFATILLWGAAKFACNAHPPENRKPRAVTAAELARDPKSAAFELQQRWSTYDFEGAAKFATGAVAEELKREQQRVCADKSACAKKQAELGETPLTLAALVAREPQRAKVKVTSLGGLGGKRDYLMEVAAEGGAWRVVSRGEWVPQPIPTSEVADAGAPLANDADGGAPAAPTSGAAGAPARLTPREALQRLQQQRAVPPTQPPPTSAPAPAPQK